MKKWLIGVLVLLLGLAGVGLLVLDQRAKQLEQALSESQQQLKRMQRGYLPNSTKKETSQKVESNTVTVDLTSTPANMELLPTLDSPSNAKNRLWVGTFQLVWNDLMDELVKGPVKLNVPMVTLLNQQAFTTADLSESAYYKKWGKASPALREEIEQGIKDKFNETSDVLHLVDWNQPQDPLYSRYILYAMLKKDFSFVEPLDKLNEEEFKGSNGLVKYFGIKNGTAFQVRKSVHVLFYNGENDFAVMLKSKQGDEVYLYRTNDDKTLDRLYADMLQKDTQTDDYVGVNDYFKAPMIDFKILREFTEVCGQEFPLYNPEIGESAQIEKAIETAQFKMDETGVRIKSEAAFLMRATWGVGPAMPVVQHRYFYLDDSYVIFIKETGKKPYFAMRVTDAKALQ